MPTEIGGGERGGGKSQPVGSRTPVVAVVKNVSRVSV